MPIDRGGSRRHLLALRNQVLDISLAYRVRSPGLKPGRPHFMRRSPRNRWTNRPGLARALLNSFRSLHVAGFFLGHALTLPGDRRSINVIQFARATHILSTLSPSHARYYAGSRWDIKVNKTRLHAHSPTTISTRQPFQRRCTELRPFEFTRHGGG